MSVGRLTERRTNCYTDMQNDMEECKTDPSTAVNLNITFTDATG